jgi:thymidine phosphorylase
VTATVESVPLICASVLSKKLAEGVDALVLDVKCGRGAFMKDLDSARQLARSLVEIANAEGVRTEAVLTSMDIPLGRMIGHSFEVVESIATLKGQGPRDLEMLSVRLAADMVRLGGLASTQQEAEQRVRSALESGSGLEKLREMITEQGGEPGVIDDYSLLPSARHSHIIEANRAGFAQGFDAEKVGQALAVLGGGRERVEEAIDHAVGAIRGSFPGDEVRSGDRLLELWYNDESRLPRALDILRDACPITDTPPTTRDRILESVVLGA